MYNLHLDFIFAAFLLFSNICCNGQPNSNGTKDLVILETFHQEVLEVQNDVVFPSKNYVASQCILETGLNMSKLVMAPGRYFKNQTFKECLQFCSENHPNMTHILISYYKALVVGSEFKCMCAESDAMKNSTEVQESKCNVKCPQSDFICGDAKNGYLSVYCLHKSCTPSSSTPICSKKLPHDPHGCVKGDFINWNFAQNVKNFTGIGGSQACTWECKDNYPRSMYSLTRKSDEVLTCSCGNGQSFDASFMMENQFCNLLDKSLDLYQVNCLDDLNPNTGPITNTTTRCEESMAVGCIFDDFLAKINSKKFAIELSSNQASKPLEVDVMSCVNGCAVIFPKNSYFAAVRMDTKGKELLCHCLGPGSFDLTMLGPEIVCSQSCGPVGSGLFCGSKDADHHHKSSSIYCIPDKLEYSSRTVLNDPALSPISQSDPSLVNGYLERIDSAIDYGNFTTQMVITLLFLLALIMLGIVIYVWKARGFSSLSRQVM